MRRRLLVVLLVAMSLLAAGCGGDDNDAADNVQTGDTSESGTDSGDGGSGDDGGTDGGVDSGLAAAFSSAECLQAAQAMAAAASVAGLAVSGQTEQVEKTTREFAALAEKAPSEVRDDIEIFSEAYSKYGQIISESGWNPTSGTPPPQSVIDALEAASKELESTEVMEAQQRLQAWFQAECPR